MKQPRMVIADTYYPDYIAAVPVVLRDMMGPQYGFELRRILEKGFGTADSYSGHLFSSGWMCWDMVANHRQLQELWCREHERKADTLERMAVEQIEYYAPDVVLLQDISFFSLSMLRYLKGKYTLAAQCSCPFPDEDKVRQLAVCFTSFPHYVPRFEALGVRGVYLPLAFDDHLLNRIKGGDRVHDVSFVGGVGTPSHWAYGMQVLETVARDIPTAKFWGYGYDLLPYASMVKAKYQGPAWGLDMYGILAQSKIFLNRHGEVSGEYANNMKLYEATGCGAMLLTEAKSNIRDFFSESECVTYTSPEDAVEKIRYYLAHEDERLRIALAGQARTLQDHTYTKRMPILSDVLKESMKQRAA